MDTLDMSLVHHWTLTLGAIFPVKVMSMVLVKPESTTVCSRITLLEHSFLEIIGTCRNSNSIPVNTVSYHHNSGLWGFMSTRCFGENQARNTQVCEAISTGSSKETHQVAGLHFFSFSSLLVLLLPTISCIKSNLLLLPGSYMVCHQFKSKVF